MCFTAQTSRIDRKIKKVYLKGSKMKKTILIAALLLAWLVCLVGCDNAFYKTKAFDGANAERICIKAFECSNRDGASSVMTIVETEFLRAKKSIGDCNNATMIIRGKIVLLNRGYGSSSFLFGSYADGDSLDTFIIEAYDSRGELLCRLIKEDNGFSISQAARDNAKEFLSKLKNK